MYIVQAVVIKYEVLALVHCVNHQFFYLLLVLVRCTVVNVFKYTPSVSKNGLNLILVIIEWLIKHTCHITFSGIWPYEFRYSPQLLKQVINDVGRHLGVLHDRENHEGDN